MTDESKGALTRAANQMTRLAIRSVNDGVGPMTGSATYAEDRLDRTNASGGGRRPPTIRRTKKASATPSPAVNAELAIKRIIRESVAAAGATGFVTGVGGLVTLPISIPANIAGSLVINARMVGAIAHLRGYTLGDPHTQAMLLLVATGSSAQAAASQLGVRLGQEAAKQAIQSVPMTVIEAINKKAGFYLLAKYGTKRSSLTLVKVVPFVGGVVGGAVDAGLTRSIGSAAKKAFPA